MDKVKYKLLKGSLRSLQDIKILRNGNELTEVFTKQPRQHRVTIWNKFWLAFFLTGLQNFWQMWLNLILQRQQITV